MPDGRSILIPRETISDDFVTIVRWHANPGDMVKAGTPLLEMDTSKAVVELEAPADGYLEISRQAGEQVPVGSEVGRLTLQPVAVREPRQEAATAVATADATAPRTMISRKAQLLLDEHGLDARDLNLAVIKEADVLAYLERHRAQPAHERPVAAAAEETRLPSAEAPANPPATRGWWADAQAAARDRGTSVVGLALNYVFRNYFLGHLVRFAPYGLIIQVHRWRGVKIGAECFIDPSATLETAYPEHITIGNDARVTANAIIMTHIKASHYLRETGHVPRVIKPVVLEDHCFIGVGAIVMPGVTVGTGAVVGSGAVVINSVPPHTLVMGNPAKVVKTFS